jgi:hypothetical protein
MAEQQKNQNHRQQQGGQQGRPDQGQSGSRDQNR